MIYRVLVVDDEELIRQNLARALENHGYEVDQAGDCASARRVIDEHNYDVILLDIRLPDGSGMSLLKKIDPVHSGVIVIMMTAYSDVDSAVSAMKAGARDYLNKPFGTEELRLAVERALKTRDMEKQITILSRQRKGQAAEREKLIGVSPKIREILNLARKISRTDDTTVLIQGESGTGKELLAGIIHESGSRASQPFVTINCTTLSAPLLESELFGHEKGAFTDAKATKTGLFEMASGGTVFLDEIGDLPLPLQGKILRVLQEKKFLRVGGVKELSADVRIIAATNRDLSVMVNEGGFRKDLFYRLNVMPIFLPPLRERPEDTLHLADYFLKSFRTRIGKPTVKFSQACRDFMESYKWPGNIREVRNVVERSIILAEGDMIELEDLMLLRDSTAGPGTETGKGFVISIPDGQLSLEAVEKAAVEKVLERCEGNQVRAAQMLGIGRGALRYKLKQYKIS